MPAKAPISPYNLYVIYKLSQHIDAGPVCNAVHSMIGMLGLPGGCNAVPVNGIQIQRVPWKGFHVGAEMRLPGADIGQQVPITTLPFENKATDK